MGLFNTALSVYKLFNGRSVGDVASTFLGFNDTPANHLVSSFVDTSSVGQYLNNRFDTVNSDSNLSRSALDEERAYNERLADIKFERDLKIANTAYQRTSQDLQSLGINPYAMLSGLNPVSQPSYNAPFSSGYAVANLQAQSNYNIARMNNTLKLLSSVFNSSFSLVNSSITALSRLGMASIYKSK